MPKYRRGSGSIYMKRGWCYIAYYANGKQVCESTNTKDKAEARRILQARLGQLAEGRYIGPAVERVTFEDLMRGLLTDYEVNGKKSLRMLRDRITKHLTPFFRGKKAQDITTAHVQTFITNRQGQGTSNAEINRELAALKRAFSLAIRSERITKKPHIPKQEENNVRQGFFESWEFTTVLAKLPDHLRPPINFAYYTGGRVQSEILSLTWPQVDLEACTVRLARGTH
jgi:integrase